MAYLGLSLDPSDILAYALILKVDFPAQAAPTAANWYVDVSIVWAPATFLVIGLL